MKTGDGLLCTLIAFGIYLSLAVIEYFSIFLLIQGFNLYYLYELLIALLFLLVINPMLVLAILNRIPLFKEKKKRTSKALH